MGMLYYDLTGPSRELYDRLMASDFDVVSLKKELDAGKYDTDAVNDAVIEYIDDCTCIEDYFMELTGEDPRKHRLPDGDKIIPGLDSSHVTEVIRLLLNYGLDPNRIYNKGTGDAVCLIDWLRFIDNGYQAADSVALLLEHGGDPNLCDDRYHYFAETDFDVQFNTINSDMLSPQQLDAFIHYWMVLIGYGAKPPVPMTLKDGFDIRELRNHRNFYFGAIHAKDAVDGWDFIIFDHRTHWEVARY